MPDYKALEKFNSQFKNTDPQGPTNPYPVLSTSNINSEGRFSTYFYGQDNEDLYGRAQGTAEKWINGFVKAGATAGTTFVGGTIGLVNGVYQAIDDGKLSSFYDNEFNRDLDQINKNLDNSMPNYRTLDERNASTLERDLFIS